MRKKNYKGRCEKRTLSKCEGVCRTYDNVQSAYADVLEASDEILEIRCNVWLEGLAEGDYTSDFVCKKVNNDILVRECTFRKLLTNPKTAKLLEVSRQFWKRHGVEDWGLVIDEEE